MTTISDVPVEKSTKSTVTCFEFSMMNPTRVQDADRDQPDDQVQRLLGAAVVAAGHLHARRVADASPALRGGTRRA